MLQNSNKISHVILEYFCFLQILFCGSILTEPGLCSRNSFSLVAEGGGYSSGGAQASPVASRAYVLLTCCLRAAYVLLTCSCRARALGLAGFSSCSMRVSSCGSAALPGLCCSAVCGIFLDQGTNLCLLHWQVGSLPLSHQGSPRNVFLDPTCKFILVIFLPLLL